MYVKRLLSINMATLAALGTLLLGMGEGSYLLPVLVFAAACVSVWWTDITGWIRLSHRTSNLCVLGAVILAIREFWVIEGASGAIAMGNLLAYVQIVLLLQEKDLRTWWHMAVLSFLQVAVAASFNQGAAFGLLLVVYGFVGLSALSLLYLHYERIHFRDVTQADAVRPGAWLRQDWQRVGKIALATLVVGPVSLFLRYHEASPDTPVPQDPPQPAPGRRRWALAGQSPAFSGTAPSFTGKAGVGWELWARLSSMNLATLALAAVVFVMIPRFEMPDWRYPRFGLGWGLPVGQSRTTGFSDTVQLGELGNVSEDPEEVMKIWFVDNASGAPYNVFGEVYLRGVVLTRYRDGSWSSSNDQSDGVEMKPGPNRLRSDPNLVRQKVEILPLDRRELFCVWPVVSTSQRSDIRIDLDRERLYRDRPGRLFKFEIGTTGIFNHAQNPLAPANGRSDPQDLDRPPRGLPELTKIAAQWVAASGISPSDPYRLARHLESEFRKPENFTYSLTRETTYENLDPIEDFLIGDKRGNCEYFATALALMLRTVGIPTRIAIGYHCDEFNTAGRYYQVRQYNAHSWVEAYLAKDQLPAGVAKDDPRWANGAWFRLDPTPATLSSGAMTLAKSWLDRIEFIWENYIKGLDTERQSQAIYNPLGGTIRAMVNPDWWRRQLGAISGLPRRVGQWLADGRWFSWRGGLVGMVFVLILYGLYRGLRLVVRPVWRRLTGRNHARGAYRWADVEFYRRLEKLLARHGLRRTPAQTQREFAAEAGRRLADGNGQAALAALPVQIADAFYAVRFGAMTLDKARLEAVEQSLGRVAEAVEEGKRLP